MRTTLLDLNNLSGSTGNFKMHNSGKNLQKVTIPQCTSLNGTSPDECHDHGNRTDLQSVCMVIQSTNNVHFLKVYVFKIRDHL